MDHDRFDRLAKWFGRSATRRAAIGTSLGGIASGLLVEADPAGAKRPAHRDNSRPGGPWPAGPCGPTGEDNRCKRNKDCCTGYCKQRANGSTGRCRCIPRGKTCKASQTCCGNGTCLNGRCTILKCTVCEKGCPFTSVNEAYAAAAPGARITVAPGTWTTGIVVDKDITITACLASNETILQADPVAVNHLGVTFIASYAETPAAPYTVTFENVTLRGTGVQDEDAALLMSYDVNPVSFVVRGCKVRDTAAFLSTFNGGDNVVENTDIQNVTEAIDCNNYMGGVGSVTITGCTIHTSGKAIQITGNMVEGDRATTTTTLTGSTITSDTDEGVNLSGGLNTITGCTITGCGMTGLHLIDNTTTVTDTAITGNTDLMFGGILVETTDVYDGSLTINGTTTVTGNHVTDAAGFSGIAISPQNYTALIVTGSSLSVVYGNTGGVDQCGLFSWGPVDWVPDETCLFA